ncbi:SGNH/GDSL hydrolase family protein [candidate division WS5 bacterium]|uniref:SGNH/GDSL hydrolase family protein n=1 Tax=candidate division WS5 bacterium TaxID=2093353 RepID=A0A419DGA2_9BACT|nr:MAG: SGNH/GDSL hydrolase family protein [candidate division WS5 bacterium]
MKKKIFYLIMFSLSIASCLFIMEYVISKYYIPQSDDYYHEFDPLLGWKPIPGCYEYKPQNSFKSHAIHINRFGIRNREIGRLRDKDTKRIVVLGDSFTFGKAVSDEVLFTTVLEHKLNRKKLGAQKYKYEVINTGIPAYGTGQQLLMMKYLADNDVIGDIYLLMMFTNDLSDNVRLLRNNLFIYAPGFVLDKDGRPVLKYLPKKNELSNHSEFNDSNRTSNETSGVNATEDFKKFILDLKSKEFFKDRIGTLLQTSPTILRFIMKLGIKIDLPGMPTTIDSWYNDDILSPGIPLLKALISEINQEAHYKNAKLLVALIPSQLEVNPNIFIPIIKENFRGDKKVDQWLKDTTRPQRITREICSTIQVPFLDLQPELYKNNNKSLYLFKDGHFNERSHAIAAESLAKFILTNEE